MTKAVITGGAGFIGSALAETLAERGYRVTIIDNLSTGSEANIARLLKDGRAELVKGSVTDLPLLQETLKGSRYVFHLAAIASVPQSIADPVLTHETNATGTLNVLLAARDNRVERVLFASSAAVYGDAPCHPQREDTPVNPQSPYAASKLAGEYYCSAFTEVYTLPTTVIRCFNVYGPCQDPTSESAGVVSRIIDTVLAGNPPVIFGNGEKTRDFIFIKDIVSAYILAAETGANGTFNIGTGESVSINRLVALIMEITGRKLPPVHKEPYPGEVGHSQADISRAASFGYRPRYTLEEGLEATVADFGEKTGAEE